MRETTAVEFEQGTNISTVTISFDCPMEGTPKMSQTTASITIGPGLGGCLTIVFVLLKAFGLIGWSWWWVFSPLWLPAAVYAAVCVTIALAGLIVMGCVFVVTEIAERRADRWL